MIKIEQFILRELMNMPRLDWAAWAAFDAPAKGTNSVKLSLYENKPEIRSDFWFPASGRVNSIYARIEGTDFNWVDSLIPIKHNHSPFADELLIISNKIVELENELAEKRNILNELMKRNRGRGFHYETR